MQCIDLKVMLGNINRKYTVWYEQGANQHGKKTGIVDQTKPRPIRQLHPVGDQQLYLEINPNAKAITVWELVLLLGQAEGQRFCYIDLGAASHPLFGYRIDRQQRRLLLA
jgi:hypothetical protein